MFQRLKKNCWNNIGYNQSINSFLFLKIPTVLSSIFWPWIISNLSIVSIVSFPRKSNRWINNILALAYSQSIHSFNLFISSKNITIVSTIFWPWIIPNLSIFSIFSFPKKFNRCFNGWKKLLKQRLDFPETEKIEYYG